MNGRTIDAEKDFQAAIGHAEGSQPLSLPPAYRSALASALIDLSEILALKSQYTEARNAADRAVELLRPLAGSIASSEFTTRDQWLLSMALTDRGTASQETGDRGIATHDFDEAERVAASIAQDDEIFNDAQDQIACIAIRRGELLKKDPAKLVESEKNFDQASGILASLIENHKLIPHYREEMAVTLCGRADVRLAMSRIPDAQSDCQAALGHLDRLIGEQTQKGAPENPQYLSLAGQVLALQSRIHFLQGRASESRKTHAQAVEKLSRAILLDPARQEDKAGSNRSRSARLSRKSDASASDDNNSPSRATREDRLLLGLGRHRSCGLHE